MSSSEFSSDGDELGSDSDASSDDEQSISVGFERTPGTNWLEQDIRLAAGLWVCLVVCELIREALSAVVQQYSCRWSSKTLIMTAIQQDLEGRQGSPEQLVVLVIMVLIIRYPSKVVYFCIIVVMMSVRGYMIWRRMSEPPAETTRCDAWLVMGIHVPGLGVFEMCNMAVIMLLVLRFIVPAEPFLELAFAATIGYAVAWVFLHTGATVPTLTVLGITLVFAVLGVRDKRAVGDERDEHAAADWKRRVLSKHLFKMLCCMMPSSLVTPMLMDPDQTQARHLDEATVLFILVEGFDCLSQKLSPGDTVKFLNHIFIRLDRICAHHGVTKVETVGAEYVCAVGVEPDGADEGENGKHSALLSRLIELALDVLELRHEVLGEPVKFRMGMHTGPLVAGVVGRKLPRFRLFGDTINTAARMMQKSLPGQAQLGEATRRCLPSWVCVICRGEVEMKGKGNVTTYLLQHRHPRTRRDLAPRPCLVDGGNAADARTESGLLRLCLSRTLGEMKLESPKSGEQFEEVIQLFGTSGRGGRVKKRCAKEFSRWPELWPELSKVDEKSFQRWALEQLISSAYTKFTCFFWYALGLTVLELSWLLYRSQQFHMLGSWSAVFFQLLPFLMPRLLALVVMALSAAAIVPGEKSLKWHRTSSLLHLVVVLVIWELILMSYSGMSWFSREPSDECPSAPRYPMVCDFTDNLNLLMATAFPCCILLWSDVRFVQSFAFIPAHFIFVNGIHQVYGQNYYYHDVFCKRAMRRTIILVIARSFLMEGLMRHRFKKQSAIDRLNERVNNILVTLMPEIVAQALFSNPDCITSMLQHQYSCATIAQSDLCGFTKLASTRQPEEVVEFIGELFGLFDALTDRFKVYKIETVGDAYIAGQAELPLTKLNSPISVVLFALGMVRATHSWSEGRGEAITCRVGVHAGHCVGGVVGHDMQRYHLFGGLMAVLEVLESTAPQGGVQVSAACSQAVSAEFDTLLQAGEEDTGECSDDENGNECSLEEGCSNDTFVSEVASSRMHMEALNSDGYGTGHTTALLKAARQLRLEPSVGEVLRTSKGELHSYDDVGGRTHLAITVGANEAAGALALLLRPEEALSRV